MQRVAPIATVLARRAYATAAESTGSSAEAVVAQGMVKAAKAAVESPSAVGGGKAEVFWMMDPKTGYWIPENRFGDVDVDVAELRELLLTKK